MLSPFYVMFNVVYQIGMLIFLWIANKDVNDDFIPGSFKPQIGYRGKASQLSLFANFAAKFFILFGEAALMVVIVTIINQLVLRATESSKKRKVIAGNTLRANSIINLCFIVLLMWGHFMAGLW